MNSLQIKKIIEASLMVSDSPLSVNDILKLFTEEEKPSNKEIKKVLTEIEADTVNKGYVLQKVANGYRFQVQDELAVWVSRLWEHRPPRYSRALLETLALVVYRQPITRAEIEDVRGVTVSGHIIRALLERKWVKVLGHKESPGRPAMYGTTKEFLDYFNLTKLQDLPELPDVSASADIHMELDLEGSETNPPNAEEGLGEDPSDSETEEMESREPTTFSV
jgi:segregation and condensation protein B